MVDKRNEAEAKQEVQNTINDMITTLEQRHVPRQEIADTINDMITSLEDGSPYPFQKNKEEDDGVSEYKDSMDGDDDAWDYKTSEEIQKELDEKKKQPRTNYLKIF